MFFVKKFANAVRVGLGADPILVTTSISMAECETSSPLASWLTGQDTSSIETLPAFFIAVAKEGFHRPKQQRWDIKVNIQDGLYLKDVLNNVSFDRMLDYMRDRELTISRESGFNGTDEEIIQQRKPVVAVTNILRFV